MMKTSFQTVIITNTGQDKVRTAFEKNKNKKTELLTLELLSWNLHIFNSAKSLCMDIN